MLLMYDVTKAKDKPQMLADLFNFLNQENVKFQVNTIQDGSKILSIHVNEEDLVTYSIINTTTATLVE